MTKNRKRKHHYIPKTYLKYFRDSKNFIHAYKLYSDPVEECYGFYENFGYIKDYHRFKTDKEDYDHNSVEDHLNENFESKWNNVVDAAIKKNLSNVLAKQMINFMCLMGTRVPAKRDGIEYFRAQIAENASGIVFTPEENPILNGSNIAINPDMNLHDTFFLAIKGIEKLLKKMDYRVLHNQTDIPFLTSDNPFVYFEYNSTGEYHNLAHPFTSKTKHYEMFFPITPNHVIHGTPRLSDGSSFKYGYGEITGKQFVKMINRLICKFSYDWIFSQERGPDELINKYSKISPILYTKVRDEANIQGLEHGWIFGKKREKIKWE